jgi:hypothetical protein
MALHGHHKLTQAKAGTMLRENRARGRPLTKKQKGLFGLIRGGGTPTRLARRRKRRGRA